MCPRLPARSNIAGTKSEPTVVCLLQAAVANEGDAWALTLDAVGRYYERVLARKADLQSRTRAARPAARGIDRRHLSAKKRSCSAQRTGELHLALASDPDDRAFAPEPFNALAQRSVYQNMRASLRRAFALAAKETARRCRKRFATEAKEVLAAEQKILAQEQRILDQQLRRDQDPDPRRLSPRAGALYRERFRHSRFRRRAGARR